MAKIKNTPREILVVELNFGIEKWDPKTKESETIVRTITEDEREIVKLIVANEVSSNTLPVGGNSKIHWVIDSPEKTKEVLERVKSSIYKLDSE
jgi:hypothetical protein